MKKLLFFSLLFLSIITSAQVNHTSEFRGFWVATVKNIDWPDSDDFEVNSQKESFVDILDFYEELNFNVAIVQIRTAGDALYPSEMAPWSRYLSGEEGSRGEWGEDPLQFMIEETHKKGMEFHAWINPYRATFDLDTMSLAESHVFYQHREWLVRYGSKFYFNPGIPEVRQHLKAVVKEILQNYEVDGIHFDDYFYPYKVEGEDFDDKWEFINYGLENYEDREDWRRSNINALVRDINETIEEVKPWVQFGISPFGVWRNVAKDDKGSDTEALQTTYDDLYADPLAWMDNQWVDYIVPQLYWSMDFPPASFRKLATWWNANAREVPVYIGIGAYKFENNFDSAWMDIYEVSRQLRWIDNLENLKGSVFFSANSLQRKEPLAQVLKDQHFSTKSFPLLRDEISSDLPKPLIGKLKIKRDLLSIDFDAAPPAESKILVWRIVEGNRYELLSMFSGEQSKGFELMLQEEEMAMVVAFVNKFNQMGPESQRIEILKTGRKCKVK